MRARSRTAVVAVALSATLAGTTGCGGPELTGTAGKDIAVLPASTVPARFGELTVNPEDVAKALEQAKHSYVDAVGFYSLRKGKVVQGTLQIARFGPSARLGSEQFRNEIIQQSSPGSPTAVNVGSAIISQSNGTKSTVSVWFSQERLVVLTVLSTYLGGRGLLEQTLTALPVA